MTLHSEVPEILSISVCQKESASFEFRAQGRTINLTFGSESQCVDSDQSHATEHREDLRV